MDNKCCFVQFIHPGGEHIPDNEEYKFWNTENHRRKFIKNKGKYIKGLKDTPKEEDIVFWAEWEPESKIVKAIANPLRNGPKYIYEPFYTKFEQKNPPLQNTDPFVFGNQFHYTICQQYRKGKPIQLRYLEKGSVILFGSCQNKSQFVLDTVFVVGDCIDHEKATYEAVLKNKITKTYEEVTIAPSYQKTFMNSKHGFKPVQNQHSLRLYFGATYNNSFNGMFCFFPCLPFDEADKGFPRPIIKLDGVITNNLPQGKKLNSQNSAENIKKLWITVVKQVLDQKLYLGVFTRLPEKKKINSNNR
jgi:hypothetical protein